MALLDGSDIQAHLPVDKIKIANVPDSVIDVQLDVERVIKGRLSNTFSALTLAGWASPEDTPQYIRAIGGRLAAALIYALRFAEDIPELSEYAQFKYGEAMSMLEMVATGNVTLPEVEEVVDTSGHLSAGYYTQVGDPKFTMDAIF